MELSSLRRLNLGGMQSLRRSHALHGLSVVWRVVQGKSGMEEFSEFAELGRICQCVPEIGGNDSSDGITILVRRTSLLPLPHRGGKDGARFCVFAGTLSWHTSEVRNRPRLSIGACNAPVGFVDSALSRSLGSGGLKTGCYSRGLPRTCPARSSLRSWFPEHRVDHALGAIFYQVPAPTDGRLAATVTVTSTPTFPLRLLLVDAQGQPLLQSDQAAPGSFEIDTHIDSQSSETTEYLEVQSLGGEGNFSLSARP